MSEKGKQIKPTTHNDILSDEFEYALVNDYDYMATTMAIFYTIYFWLWHFGVLIMQNSLSSILIKKKLLNCKVFHSRKVLNYLLPANFSDVFFSSSSSFCSIASDFFSLSELRTLIKWLRCCFFLCWIFVIFSFPVVFSTLDLKFSSHSFKFRLLPGFANVESFVLYDLKIGKEKKRGQEIAHCLKIHSHTFTWNAIRLFYLMNFVCRTAWTFQWKKRASLILS